MQKVVGSSPIIRFGEPRRCGAFSFLMDQVVQVIGALLILAGFAAAQFGWLTPASRTYLWLNLVGSLILFYLAFVEEQWGFVLLEGVWALVSAWSLLRPPAERAPAA